MNGKKTIEFPGTKYFGVKFERHVWLKKSRVVYNTEKFKNNDVSTSR